MRPIDADSLLKQIDLLQFGAMEFAEFARVNHIVRIIQSQQPIDLAPVVHGEWIENDTPFTRQRKCSVCGHNDNPKTAIKGHFCWYCGAKMDGKTEPTKEDAK